MIFSKGYGLICEANGGLLNLLGPTEALIKDWQQARAYPTNARSHWVKMGSRGGAEGNLRLWSQHILPNLQHDFVLVTSDGDSSVPDGVTPDLLQAILENPYLRRWYASNVNELFGERDPRIISIPIGLDAHTLSPAGNWTAYRETLDQARERGKGFRKTGKIFVDFGINQTHPFRGEILRQLRWHRSYRILKRRFKRPRLLERYGQHGFVLSVRGNGHDCHRTWEALAVGAYVIAHTPEINQMLARYGVFTVQDQSDLQRRDLAEQAAAHYAAHPPRVPSFRDVIFEEDWPYCNWDSPHVL